MPNMLSKLTRIVATVLLMTPMLIAPIPVIAQSSPPSPVCVARPGNNPDSPTFVAVIPPNEQQAMADRGFTPHACVVDPSELNAYRAKVCHLANDTPAEVQVQFGEQYNISPRALCDMANTLAGHTNG